MKCPECSKEMKNGYISGNGCKIRWGNTPEMYGMISGSALEGKRANMFSNPSYQSYMCSDCHIVIVKYLE